MTPHSPQDQGHVIANDHVAGVRAHARKQDCPDDQTAPKETSMTHIPRRRTLTKNDIWKEAVLAARRRQLYEQAIQQQRRPPEPPADPVTAEPAPRPLAPATEGAEL